MSKEKLITIIIPIYNVEKYLSKCIESVINQTYKNLEIILIDDGSTDSSGIICNQYSKKDSRIKLIHIKNSGVSNARNVGLDNASGDWIVFVDSDDWLEFNFCERLYEIVMNDPSIDIVCSGYKRIYADTVEPINCDKKKIYYNNYQYLLKLLNVQNGYGFCHMKLIRKECIKKIRFNNKIVVAEDALFNMQILKNVRKVLQIGEGLYNYRFNENSLVRKYDKNYLKKYLNAMKETYKYIKQEYKYNQEILKNFYNYVSYHVLLISVNYYFNPKNSVLVGGRDIEDGEYENLKNSGITIFTTNDIKKYGATNIMKKAINIAIKNSDGIHISYDIDVIDPKIAPGVSVKATNGINLSEAKELLNEILKQKDKINKTNLRGW